MNQAPIAVRKFHKVMSFVKGRKLHPKIIFFTLGIVSTLWFLIRVIPKPSRASYPCMQATAPYMSAFVLWLTGFGGAIFSAKKVQFHWSRSQYFLAFLFLISTTSFFILFQYSNQRTAGAAPFKIHNQYFPANEPIGTAQGIFLGRVSWFWNPYATNELCTNTSNNNGVIDTGDDAWFMAKNNNSAILDTMIIESLKTISGEENSSLAWDALFHYFNETHGFGKRGYSVGEKILIKTNATSAYGGVSGEKYDAELSRNDDTEINPFSAETNPYVVLSIIKQLVNEAGIPQNMIYIGDPARNTYKEFYELWHNDFPDIHYLGNNLIHNELEIISLGRTPVALTEENLVFYSDQGNVMPDAIQDKLFTVFEDIDYLINIPTLKAHASAGITLSAKNHFGSLPRTWAMHVHQGLIAPLGDDPEREGYGLYRIQTDIMMHKLLSGKNLIMMVDGLYPSNDALAVPEKWDIPPFSGHWCSSIFMSLDPVAIESVCHDFLRAEYHGSTIAESRPNWFGVDDYLHQAADSALWPVVYDPDQDGILIASLGVHEHWNDSLNKEYTRNLETGNGIELVKVHEPITGISDQSKTFDIQAYPNPTLDILNIKNNEKSSIQYQIISTKGDLLLHGAIPALDTAPLNINYLQSGTYILVIEKNGLSQKIKIIKQ